MQRKRFAMWFGGFSFLFLLSACDEGPDVEWCIHDPVAKGFQCAGKKGEADFFCSYSDPRCARLIGTSPSSFDIVLQWIKDHRK